MHPLWKDSRSPFITGECLPVENEQISFPSARARVRKEALSVSNHSLVDTGFHRPDFSVLAFSRLNIAGNAGSDVPVFSTVHTAAGPSVGARYDHEGCPVVSRVRSIRANEIKLECSEHDAEDR